MATKLCILIYYLSQYQTFFGLIFGQIYIVETGQNWTNHLAISVTLHLTLVKKKRQIFIRRKFHRFLVQKSLIKSRRKNDVVFRSCQFQFRYFISESFLQEKENARFKRNKMSASFYFYLLTIPRQPVFIFIYSLFLVSQFLVGEKDVFNFLDLLGFHFWIFFVVFIVNQNGRRSSRKDQSHLDIERGYIFGVINKL